MALYSWSTQARRKPSREHGGQRNRHDADAIEIVAPTPSQDIERWTSAHEAEAEEPKAQLVKLRYFAGLSEEDAALC